VNEDKHWRNRRSIVCIRRGEITGATTRGKQSDRSSEDDWTRVVASGTNQRIGFFYALNPDCTASGNVNVRVTKQPEHGTTEITPAILFPNFRKENIRYKCNQHKVKGMQINYKSAEKYTGDDALELLVLFPAGFAWEVHYDVSVR
jgi:hypothetical protein